MRKENPSFHFRGFRLGLFGAVTTVVALGVGLVLSQNIESDLPADREDSGQNCNSVMLLDENNKENDLRIAVNWVDKNCPEGVTEILD